MGLIHSLALIGLRLSEVKSIFYNVIFYWPQCDAREWPWSDCAISGKLWSRCISTWPQHNKVCKVNISVAMFQGWLHPYCLDCRGCKRESEHSCYALFALLLGLSEVTNWVGIWYSCISCYNHFRRVLDQECQDVDQLRINAWTLVHVSLKR